MGRGFVPPACSIHALDQVLLLLNTSFSWGIRQSQGLSPAQGSHACCKRGINLTDPDRERERERERGNLFQEPEAAERENNVAVFRCEHLCRTGWVRCRPVQKSARSCHHTHAGGREVFPWETVSLLCSRHRLSAQEAISISPCPSSQLRLQNDSVLSRAVHGLRDKEC